MFEEDYVMRIIKEAVRALLKLLFGIEHDESFGGVAGGRADAGQDHRDDGYG